MTNTTQIRWGAILRNLPAQWIVALVFTVAALALHLLFLSHSGGFWRDEVNTLNLSGRASLSQMANDSFPILMPSIVRVWCSLGLASSDRRLRLLGVAIGLGILGAVWVVSWAGRRLPPLLSLVLIGLNGVFVFYGDSLRAFGLGSLLVTLTMAALCGFLRQSGWKQVSWLALAALLSVQALYQNTVLLAALCLGAGAVCWRRHDGTATVKLLIAAVPAAISLLPYWPKVAPLLFGSPGSSVATLRTVFRPALALGSLGTATGGAWPGLGWVWAAALLVVVWFAAVEMRANRKPAVLELKPEGDLRLMAAVTLLGSVLGFAVFLWFARLRTEPWYFLPSLVLAAVCFELGWPLLRGGALGAWLALLVAIGGLAVSAAIHTLRYRFTNVDLIARRLRQEASPSDYVVVIPWNSGISFERYFRDWAPWDTVPPLPDHSTHRYDLVQHQLLAPEPLRLVFDRLTNTLQAGRRVWVVGAVDIPSPGFPVPRDLPPPPLKYTGWSTGPYVRNWTDQVTQFLSNHSRQFVSVPMPNQGPINQNERLELFVADGWQKGD